LVHFTEKERENRRKMIDFLPPYGYNIIIGNKPNEEEKI